jgi:hypothetical protein
MCDFHACRVHALKSCNFTVGVGQPHGLSTFRISLYTQVTHYFCAAYAAVTPHACSLRDFLNLLFQKLYQWSFASSTQPVIAHMWKICTLVF